jgi:hypothetical protein
MQKFSDSLVGLAIDPETENVASRVGVQEAADSLVELAIEPESEYVVGRVASFLSGYSSAWYMQQVAQADHYPFIEYDPTGQLSIPLSIVDPIPIMVSSIL